MMKKTKIICTVGPSTDSVELLTQMIQAGMDMARFNFSHGDYAGHKTRIALVREAAARAGKAVALPDWLRDGILQVLPAQ